IEWKLLADRPDADQSRAAAFGKIEHRVKVDFLRLFSTQRREQLLFVCGDGLARTDGEISTKKTPRLFVDGLFGAPRQAAHGDQSRNPHHDRRGKEKQSTAARASVAPRHPPRPFTKQMSDSDHGT